MHGQLQADTKVERPSLVIGDTFPAWQLETPTSDTIEYPAHTAGQPSIILFWASWCPYCKALMPHLQNVYDTYRGRGLKYYAINIKEDGDPVATLKQRGQDPLLLLDGDEFGESVGVFATPGLFLVDAKGQVIYKRKSGASPEQIEMLLRFLLEKQYK